MNGFMVVEGTMQTPEDYEQHRADDLIIHG